MKVKFQITEAFDDFFANFDFKIDNYYCRFNFGEKNIKLPRKIKPPTKLIKRLLNSNNYYWYTYKAEIESLSIVYESVIEIENKLILDKLTYSRLCCHASYNLDFINKYCKE